MASALGTGIGGAELGYGLSMNPSINLQNPMTELQPDQQAIQQQQGVQQGITNQNLSDQTGLNQQYMGQLQNLGNQDYQNLTTQLGPSGPLGQQLSGEFANYGITPNSGAFQEV